MRGLSLYSDALGVQAAGCRPELPFRSSCTKDGNADHDRRASRTLLNRTRELILAPLMTVITSTKAYRRSFCTNSPPKSTPIAPVTCGCYIAQPATRLWCLGFGLIPSSGASPDGIALSVISGTKGFPSPFAPWRAGAREPFRACFKGS